ncbi:hypothetical protein [Pseudactinotalea terrae]|uniref:hypothetical protein n=1 Tax=Pseudactinotalea terrae TaxID=1743262 RepID=UPI0019D682FF|nr:hypothetical protein [Pseudactinotalea terrae]
MSHRFDLDWAAARELRRAQDGVVTLQQLYRAGASWHDIERMVRRRELRRVHPGVYIDHTGPMTRRQRDWVAVLAAWPAALADESALPGGTVGMISIVVGPGRKVKVPVGVRVRRNEHREQRVQWQRSSPRIRVEHATVDVMSVRIRDGDVAAAFAALARVVQSRETTAERILAALQTRSRVSGRRLIEQMLTDVRDGICSVLERGFRDHVERPHVLPQPSPQHGTSATGAMTHQDVRYGRYSLVVELDGPRVPQLAAGP